VIQDVHKAFAGTNGVLPVLWEITLDVRAGEFLSIVGGSGCGKSTLLRAIAGLETVDSGRVFLDGVPITRPGIDRGLVFQEHRLMPWLTVAQNVSFGRKERVGRGPDEEVSRYIALVGLQGFERSYPHQLSGGMAQRAAIARALITGRACCCSMSPSERSTPSRVFNCRKRFCASGAPKEPPWCWSRTTSKRRYFSAIALPSCRIGPVR